MLEEAEPRADAEAALDGSPSGVASTAARALALGAAFSSPWALHGLEGDLREVGLASVPPLWGTWSERVSLIEASDRVLESVGVAAEIDGIEREGIGVRRAAGGRPAREERVALWAGAATGDPAVAMAWLRTLMADREPITSAAAAAALLGWQARSPDRVPLPLAHARALTAEYAESDVPEARAIAVAALGTGAPVPPARGPDDTEPSPEDVETPPARSATESTSLLVHGTAAWAGSWWFPGGDFHSYVLSEIRRDLYSGGDTFTWSGAYRGRHRRVAAERLAGWAKAAAGGPLNTIFAHSYGGIIALNATTFGLEAREIVLLSAPGEDVPVDWRRVGRAVSLRIHLDLILLAARRPQRFANNVAEHHLPRWFWSHGDAHSCDVWQREDCRAILNL